MDYVFGLSTQDTAYQQEVVERLHLPFALLSDEHLTLARAIKSADVRDDGMTLLKRLTMVIRDGLIERVFYPVFPPDRNATEVIAWLKGQGG